MALLAWLLLSAGLAVSVFGGALLTWSLLGERPDLWPVGIPFTLAGQAALVLGLVFRLDGLLRRQREASDSLHALDDQLDELRQTTTKLSAAHSSPTQSFYLHMAEGASPEILLADLKGQLDLLTENISQR